jgi:hypothetical protein
LLLDNEYLAAENRVLRAKLPSKLWLGNPERATFAQNREAIGAQNSSLAIFGYIYRNG